jgi:hypothetical protein
MCQCFYLDGDRKANIEILEANKTANTLMIRDLRTENKELRKALAVVQAVSRACCVSPELFFLVMFVTFFVAGKCNERRQ